MVCAWSMNSIPAGHTLKIRLTAALRNSAASMEGQHRNGTLPGRSEAAANLSQASKALARNQVG